MNGEKLKNLRFFYIIPLLYGFLHVAPMPVDAQELRFQIVIGGKQAVKKACQSSNYSKYHVVNGTSCAEFKPKKKKINQSVLDLQRLLTELGYDPGPTDGLAGKKTRNAAQQAFEDRGLSFSGRLDAASLNALRDADAKQAVTQNEGVWFTKGDAIQSCKRGGCITFYCGTESLRANFKVPYEYAGKSWENSMDEYSSKFYFAKFDDYRLGWDLPSDILDYEIDQILAANTIEIRNSVDDENLRQFDLNNVKSKLRSLYNSCQHIRPEIQVPIDDGVQYSSYEWPPEYAHRLQSMAIVRQSSAYNQCKMEQQSADQIFSNLSVMWSAESSTSVNDHVAINWAGLDLPAAVPAWLIISSNKAARFEGNGIAITENAIAPFGLKTGASTQRLLIPLNVRDIKEKGTIKVDFLKTEIVDLELSAVAFLPACREKEQVVFSEKKQFKIIADYPKITASSTIEKRAFEVVYSNNELGRTIAYDNGTFVIRSLTHNSELNQVNGSRLRVSPNGRFAVIDRSADAALVDLVDAQIIGSLANYETLQWGWEDSILIGTSYPHGATTILFPLGDWSKTEDRVAKKGVNYLHSDETRLYVDIHNSMIFFGPSDDTYTEGPSISVYDLYTAETIAWVYDDGPTYRDLISDKRIQALSDEEALSALELSAFLSPQHMIVPLSLPDHINIPQGYSRGVEITLPQSKIESENDLTNSFSNDNLVEQLARIGLPIQTTNWISSYLNFRKNSPNPVDELRHMVKNADWRVEIKNSSYQDLDTSCDKYKDKRTFERPYIRSVAKLTGKYANVAIVYTHCESQIWNGVVFQDYYVLDFNKPQPVHLGDAVIIDGTQANGFVTSFASNLDHETIGQSGDFLIFKAKPDGSIGVYHLPTKKIQIYKLAQFGHSLATAHISNDLNYLVTEHTDGVFQIFELDFSNSLPRVEVRSEIAPVEPLFTGRVMQGEIVVWNKYGYFDATADAASLIDVIFEGTDLQFSLDQFSDLLYVRNLIKTGKSEIEKQDKEIPFPPQITGQIFSIDSKAKASFEFPRVENLDVLEVYQDGVLTQNEKLEPGANKWTGQFNLLPGVQTVAAVVKSTEGLSSRPLTFSLGKRETLPVVKSLAVAVDRYSDPALTDLNYAKADAARVLSSLKTISGEHIELIDNQFIGGRRATPDKVYDAVDQLVQEAAPHEHLVLFMAGHGLQSEDGDFYLALHSTDVKEIADTAVSFSRLFEALSTTSAKVTVLIDACHSGDAGTGIFATTDGALQNLGNIPSNVTILAAAKGRQESIESEQLQGGYFSVAFEDVISNSRARYDVNNNERIEATELQAGLYDFVTEKTNGKQTPWMTKGRIIGDFSLF